MGIQAIWDGRGYGGDKGTVREGPGGHQGFDEGSEGQDQGDRDTKYQGYRDVLQYGGDKIGPSGGAIEDIDQGIVNE